MFNKHITDNLAGHVILNSQQLRFTSMQYDLNYIQCHQNVSAPVVVTDGGLVTTVVDCGTVKVAEAAASDDQQTHTMSNALTGHVIPNFPIITFHKHAI